MEKYDHEKIEKKWQKYWDKNKTFKAEIDQSKPKYYVLDMFPYASGTGLHVGHAVGYTATDIIYNGPELCAHRDLNEPDIIHIT